MFLNFCSDSSSQSLHLTGGILNSRQWKRTYLFFFFTSFCTWIGRVPGSYVCNSGILAFVWADALHLPQDKIATVLGSASPQWRVWVSESARSAAWSLTSRCCPPSRCCHSRKDRRSSESSLNNGAGVHKHSAFENKRRRAFSAERPSTTNPGRITACSSFPWKLCPIDK